MTTTEIDKDELSLAKRIAANNAKFLASTPAQKRVAIAKDVLLQLELGTFEPQGGYLMKAYDEVCRGCMLAGVFASKCNLSRERLTTGFTQGSVIYEDLVTEGIFTRDQLGLIEGAYERDWGMAYRAGNSDKMAKRAARYARRVENEVQRMRRIMTNIIRNKGTFKP